MCLNVLAVGRFHSAAGEGRWMERLRDVQSLAGQTAGETHRTAASVVAVAAELKLTRCVHFNDTLHLAQPQLNLSSLTSQNVCIQTLLGPFDLI